MARSEYIKARRKEKGGGESEGGTGRGRREEGGGEKEPIYECPLLARTPASPPMLAPLLPLQMTPYRLEPLHRNLPHPFKRPPLPLLLANLHA